VELLMLGSQIRRQVALAQKALPSCLRLSSTAVEAATTKTMRPTQKTKAGRGGADGKRSSSSRQTTVVVL
jgi:hypothetical protein